MEVRDPIHGMIEYDKTEEKIINSEPFQRLRNIKQLALAQYLYPGAHHTRFEHSLGVMHVASRMYDKLKERGEKDGIRIEDFGYSREIIRKAALLHDIGHGPFSHVSEAIFSKITGISELEKITGKKDEEAHEFLSYRIVEEFFEEILSEDDIKRIKQIIKKSNPNALSEIISGPLDADKLDYLLRDSYYTGVKYGIYDLERVLNTLFILSGTKTTLGIKEEGKHAIEQYIMSKYYITNQVYGHINRQITDHMLIRCIYLAYLEDIEAIKQLYTLVDDKEIFKYYLSYDDNSLIDLICTESRGYAKEYAERLKRRQLLKYSKAINLNDLDNTDDGIKIIDILSDDKKREESEIKLAEHFEIPKELIIILYLYPKNPFAKLYSTSYKDISDNILVQTKDNKRKTFTKVSDLEINLKKEILAKIFILKPDNQSDYDIIENEIIDLILK